MKTHRRIIFLLSFIMIGFFSTCEEEDIGLDTDAESPQVISTAPANGAVDIPTNITIQAVFSEGLEPTTVNESSFIIQFNDSLTVPGEVSYSSNTVTFMPDSNLEPNTEFTAELIAIIEDLNGNHLEEDYRWTFKTAE